MSQIRQTHFLCGHTYVCAETCASACPAACSRCISWRSSARLSTHVVDIDSTAWKIVKNYNNKFSPGTVPVRKQITKKYLVNFYKFCRQLFPSSVGPERCYRSPASRRTFPATPSTARSLPCVSRRRCSSSSVWTAAAASRPSPCQSTPSTKRVFDLKKEIRHTFHSALSMSSRDISIEIGRPRLARVADEICCNSLEIQIDTG